MLISCCTVSPCFNEPENDIQFLEKMKRSAGSPLILERTLKPPCARHSRAFITPTVPEEEALFHHLQGRQFGLAHYSLVRMHVVSTGGRTARAPQTPLRDEVDLFLASYRNLFGLGSTGIENRSVAALMFC